MRSSHRTSSISSCVFRCGLLPNVGNKQGFCLHRSARLKPVAFAYHCNRNGRRAAIRAFRGQRRLLAVVTCLTPVPQLLDMVVLGMRGSSVMLY